MLTKILSLKKEEKKILAALAFPHTYTFHFRQVSYRCVVLSSTSRQGRRAAAMASNVTTIQVKSEEN
jgi:hypothetical protein